MVIGVGIGMNIPFLPRVLHATQRGMPRAARTLRASGRLYCMVISMGVTIVWS